MITKIAGIVFVGLTGLGLTFGLSIVSPVVMGVIALVWAIAWIAKA